MADGDSGLLGFGLIGAGVVLVFIGIAINALTGAFFGPAVSSGTIGALQAQQFAQFEVSGFWAAGVVCIIIGIIILAT